MRMLRRRDPWRDLFVMDAQQHVGTSQAFDSSGMVAAVIVLDISWTGPNNGPRFIDLEAHGVEVTRTAALWAPAAGRGS